MKLCLVLLCATTAGAASRARYGGTLKVAFAARQTEADPLLADTPGEAALVGLVAQPLCRLERGKDLRRVDLLASEMTPLPGDRLHIALKPNLALASKQKIAGKEVVEALMRATKKEFASPYRALLYPLRTQGRQLSSSVTSENVLDLSTSFPWPDLDESLCHPAFAITDARSLDGVGPFRLEPGGGSYSANPTFPAGRPYTDAVAVTRTDERRATNLLQRAQTSVAIGAGTDDFSPQTGPLLYATYLAFQPARVGSEFRPAFESSVDRADLVNLFVKKPAAPLWRLLPNGANEPLRAPAAPKAVSKELALYFDNASDDERAVAERLQVKLHDRGYKIALKPLTRADLRARWLSGDYDLLMHSPLMPPLAAPALAIVLDASGRHDLLATQLPLLGAVADAEKREARAREMADQLQGELPIIPLYAQGLRIQSLPKTDNVYLDAFGLPVFDSIFLE